MNELRQEPAVISLRQGLEEQADDPRFTTLMDIDLSVNLPSETNVDPIETTHILAITNEALSNAARHAQARQVKIAAFVENGRLHLTMKDNGRGFPKNSDNSGYGLRNMRDRARLLGVPALAAPGG
jgi:signal transduction histidine kinase